MGASWPRPPRRSARQWSADLGRSMRWSWSSGSPCCAKARRSSSSLRGRDRLGFGRARYVGGGILGLAGGAAIGALIYLGLLAIPLRRLFTVTSWLILLLAAGMASQGAAFLMQANLLPSLGNDLWDTSSILSENSMLGLLLHVLIGYSAQPAGIQVVFYLATLLVVGTLMRMLGRASPSSQSGPAATASIT